MKIVINCLNLLGESQGAGGAGSYITSLITELSELAEVKLLVKPNNFLRFKKIQKLDVLPCVSDVPKYLQSHLEWADIYFSPLNGLTPAYFDFSQVTTVTTILDLQHEVFPHFFKKGIYEARRYGYGHAISCSDAIITISQNEKDLIQSVYGKEQVFVSYLSGYLGDKFAQGLDASVMASIDTPSTPYIIYPAIPWQHKNHYRLLQGIYVLKQEFPDLKNTKLVLTGSEHSLSTIDLRKEIAALDLQENVEVKGFVSDLELACLIKNAEFMIFPSLYEGFGIPVVDAMKLGIPVLTTRCAAIPEVAGDAVAYLENPFDSFQIATDISALLIDEPRKKLLRDLGEKQGTYYSAQATAQATMDAFESALESQREQATLNSGYFDVQNLAKYKRKLTQEQLSILVDFQDKNTKQEDLEKIIDCSSLLGDLIKIVLLLPINIDSEMLVSLRTHPEILCLYNNTPEDRIPFMGYVLERGISTKYIMYCSSLDSIEKVSSINIAQILSLLDNFTDIEAVRFLDNIEYPERTSTLERTDLLTQYELYKSRKLEFFELTVLRTEKQDHKFHLGQYKYLSDFLSTNSCLNYPIK